jgi:hypothetical protein
MPPLRISQLVVHPVKGCRGVQLQRCGITGAGLQLDRQWMVVNSAGRFCTQARACGLAQRTRHALTGSACAASAQQAGACVGGVAARGSPQLVRHTRLTSRCLEADALYAERGDDKSDASMALSAPGMPPLHVRLGRSLGDAARKAVSVWEWSGAVRHKLLGLAHVFRGSHALLCRQTTLAKTQASGSARSSASQGCGSCASLLTRHG